MSGWLQARGEKNRPPMISISLLGDAGSGKTSIKKRLVGKEFNSNEQITIGADYSFHKLENFEGTRLKIADIAGQVSFDAVRQKFLTGSDAAIIVFDLTNPKTLHNLKNWLNNYIKANRRSKIQPPVLLLGNKVDLDRQIPLKAVKEFLEVIQKDYLYTDRIIGYMETSAKTGENIIESFETVTMHLLDN